MEIHNTASNLVSPFQKPLESQETPEATKTPLSSSNESHIRNVTEEARDHLSTSQEFLKNLHSWFSSFYSPISTQEPLLSNRLPNSENPLLTDAHAFVIATEEKAQIAGFLADQHPLHEGIVEFATRAKAYASAARTAFDAQDPTFNIEATFERTKAILKDIKSLLLTHGTEETDRSAPISIASQTSLELTPQPHKDDIPSPTSVELDQRDSSTNPEIKEKVDALCAASIARARAKRESRNARKTPPSGEEIAEEIRKIGAHSIRIQILIKQKSIEALEALTAARTASSAEKTNISLLNKLDDAEYLYSDLIAANKLLSE